MISVRQAKSAMPVDTLLVLNNLKRIHFQHLARRTVDKLDALHTANLDDTIPDHRPAATHAACQRWQKSIEQQSQASQHDDQVSVMVRDTHTGIIPNAARLEKERSHSSLLDVQIFFLTCEFF